MPQRLCPDEDWKDDGSSPAVVKRERHELTRRIPIALIKEIEGQTAHLTPTPQNIRAFKEGIWIDPVFSDPQWYRLAFRAYLNGDISHIVLQKVFLFACCKDHTRSCGDVPSYQLFNGTKFDEPSKKMIFQAFFQCYPRTSLEEAQKKFDLFLSQIQSVDPFDTQFFSLWRPSHLEDPLFDVLVKLEKNPPPERAWIRFGVIDCGYGSFHQIVCLPKIVNLVHKIFRGPSAKQGMPCFGFLKMEKLSDLDYRPVIMPCPLLPNWGIPRTIDNYSCKVLLSGTFHDLAFHGLLEAQMPSGHRKAFSDFALSLKESDLEERTKKVVSLSFLDKNFRAYGEHDPAIAFWKSVEEAFVFFNRKDHDVNSILNCFLTFFTSSKLEEYSISLESLKRADLLFKDNTHLKLIYWSIAIPL